MLDVQKSPDENLLEVQGWIRRGSVDASHPFRYLTLSTTDENRATHSRMLVLREVTDENGLILFTDSRSAKISHIRTNDSAGLLFWDSKRRVQLSLSVKVHELENEQRLKRYESRVKGKAQESYTTVHAPGAAVSHPDDAAKFHHFDEKNFFTVLQCDVLNLTALQLGRERHLRLFCENNPDGWECSWVVP